MGMGGGTILILLLSLFMGVDQHIAQATNLVFFIPTAIGAIVIGIKNKNVHTHYLKHPLSTHEKIIILSF